MFAPEGYAVFGDVDALFRRWSEDAIFDPDPGSYEDVRREREWLRHDLWTEFLRACPSLSVASPTGRIMRVSRSLCAFIGADAGDPTFEGYVFLDRAWIVRIEGADARISAAVKAARKSILGYRNTPLPPGKEDLQLHLFAEVSKEISKVSEAWITNSAAFAPFEGWALTCRADDVADLDLQKLTANAQPAAKGKGGRPRKLEDISPLLAENDSIKALEAAYKADTGKTVSRRTIQRAKKSAKTPQDPRQNP